MKEINGPSGGTSERPRPATVQSAHEAAFSLNLSMLVVAAFYVLYPYVPVFERIEQYLEGMDIGGWSTLSTRSQHLSYFLAARLLGAASLAVFARVRVCCVTASGPVPPRTALFHSRSKMERGVRS